MRRRELLAGLAGAGVVGGAAVAVQSGIGRDEAERIESLELRGIEAAGSQGGTVAVPERGRVSFVEVFATWCTVCESSMPELAAAHEAVGEDVQFVSVTNEPLGHTLTAEDVAAWWDDHGGAWQVAHDVELRLSDQLGATGVPHAVVLDEENRETWSHRGRISAEGVETAVRDALE